VVGKRAGAHSGVSRAEAQISLVVNEACDDDDMCVLASKCPGYVPTVLGEDWTPQGERSRPKTKTLKKGMVVVRVRSVCLSFTD
jgi:hypothetical protein